MATIVIFDSGVGGLSIHAEVSALLPQHRYVFVSDNLAYPYGTKPEDELNSRVVALMHRITKAYQPDIAIVACNTASTVVLPLLRHQFNYPIVGVVPAIKPAAALSKSKHIALLATPATVARPYTDRLVQEFAQDCHVTKVGSSILVDLAEAKLYGRNQDSAALEGELAPILAVKKCDQLVLACTHFPLLNNEISNIFKANNHAINLVDSGQGIARRVAHLLASIESLPSNTQSESMAVFTRCIEDQEIFIDHLASRGLTHAGLLAK